MARGRCVGHRTHRHQAGQRNRADASDSAELSAWNARMLMRCLACSLEIRRQARRSAKTAAQLRHLYTRACRVCVAGAMSAGCSSPCRTPRSGVLGRSACLVALQFSDEHRDQVNHRRLHFRGSPLAGDAVAWIRAAVLAAVHPALTSRLSLSAVAGGPARTARALAARMAVRPSSIAMDTKMRLSVRAPTVIWLAAIQLPS